VRSVAATLLNRILAPLGVEIRRRRPGEARPTGTLSNALGCLREKGFRPATAVDVGVAEGTDALYEAFPAAHHVLIEPMREFVPHLERIVSGLRHAEYVLAAAGPRSGTTELHLARHLEVTSTRRSTDRALALDQQRTVECVTLDEIWRARRLAGPALLKLDVEGAELDVIAGAGAMLGSCGCLVVEVAFQDLYEAAPRAEQTIAELARLGFLLFDVVGAAYHGGRLVTADLVLVRREWL
jgi:FkbM family methyltransferase